MRERLTGIAMTAFRGVPGELAIDLPRGESLLIYGENGCGKSSVADAIEWYFRGSLELLSKEGREHALRNLGDPKATARVAIATKGSLAGSCEDKKPNKAAMEVANLETFILRGRTIAEFVDKSKGEKWSALQKLLGLGGIDDLRQDLQKARGELKRAHDGAKRELAVEAAALQSRGVEPVDVNVIEKVSDLARSCGRRVRLTIDDYLSADVGASAPPPDDKSARTTALRHDLEQQRAAVEVDLASLTTWNEWVTAATGASAASLDLIASAARLCSRNSEAFAHCPVCAQPVVDVEFRSRIETELAGLQEHAAYAARVRNDADCLVDNLRNLAGSHSRFCSRARDLDLLGPALPDDPTSVLQSALKEHAPIDVALVTRWIDGLRSWDTALREVLDARAENSGATSVASGAMELGALLHVVRRWKAAGARVDACARALARADVILEPYQEAQRDYVATILREISADVDLLYQRLHPNARIRSVAVETWDDKGIELSVDFHGTRQRPPQGVLSESYMNSLAIALFLAMARKFNERIGFLVLDDVVNSFDVSNRTRLGDLMVEELSDWQVILLTHDRYFFEQMKGRGTGWSVRQFTAWSFESGPIVREHRQTGEVETALAELGAGDVGNAARRGRRALEQTLKDVCEGIGVPLPYARGRDNELREVGGLLLGLRSHLKKVARQFALTVEDLLSRIDADTKTVWNVESHASDLAPAADDVRGAVERLQAFERLWSCADCKTPVFRVEGARCRCGKCIFPPAGSS